MVDLLVLSRLDFGNAMPIVIGTPAYLMQQLTVSFECSARLTFLYKSYVSVRVVKTAYPFWPVNRDQKDRLTAAAYTAPATIVPHASLFAGRLSLTAPGLNAVTAVAFASSNLYHMLQ